MSLKNSSVKIKIPKLLQKKLNNKKIKKIYKRFERSTNINESFGVAVSGGPDSLALVFLAKIYALKKGLKAFFFIVDHKLRSESTKEALKVKKILKKNHINAEILTWRGKKPSKNIQSIARKKRYELLSQRCKKIGINYIFLGHHQDDLFENFFIRFLRGSGLKGLISLGKINRINNLNILRPLLNEKKKDLIFISNFIFNFYVEDPTNNDNNYKRVRLRKLIKSMKEEGFDENKLRLTLNNLRESNVSINYYVKKNIDTNSKFFKDKSICILKKSFFIQPQEIVFRSFVHILKIIGMKYYNPRGKSISLIINNINGKFFHKATLSGCIIEKISNSIKICRENSKKI